jgi:hypothetical protein
MYWSKPPNPRQFALRLGDQVLVPHMVQLESGVLPQAAHGALIVVPDQHPDPDTTCN